MLLLWLHVGKIHIENIEYLEELVGQKIGLLIKWKVYYFEDVTIISDELVISNHLYI